MIPEIAITPFESSFEDISTPINESGGNITETLTDVEDLYDDSTKQKPKAKKSKLKIKLDTDGATTDMEDVEASDDEDEINIAQHKMPLSLSDLDLGSCSVEDETDSGGKTIRSYKLNCLEVAENLDGYLTDQENFSTEDDDDETADVIPEIDIEFEEFRGNCVISSKGQDMPVTPEPLLLVPQADKQDLTDCETLGNEEDWKKSKTRRRRPKGARKSHCGTEEGCHPKGKSCGIEKDCIPLKSGRMKKSISLPSPTTPTLADSDGEDKCRFALCKDVVKKNEATTDVEDLEDFKAGPSHFVKRKKPIDIPNSFSGVQREKQEFKRKEPKQSLPACAQALTDFFTGNTCATDDELIEDEENIEEIQMPELKLPPPIRTLVVLSEKEPLIPTTKILPLDDDIPINEHEYPTAIQYLRQTSPIHRRRSVARNRVKGQFLTLHFDIEPVTDTEDLLIETDRNRTEVKNIKQEFVDSTDTEGFDTDEDLSVGDYRRSSMTPCYAGEIESGVILSKDHESVSTTKNSLEVSNVRRRKSISDALTDTEDLYGSGDDEVFARAETVIPSDLQNQLDQAQFSKVHVGSGSKLNFDTPSETMYLKGGGYYVQGHTDVEEISDDDVPKPERGEILHLNVKDGSVCFGLVKEWDVAKKSPKQETPVAQDAEQQVLSPEVLSARPNFVTYESVLLRPDCDMLSFLPVDPIEPTSIETSYKHIDAMLEKMLFEVERQEKLFSLDLDVLEPDSSYTNTLELLPETDAVVEIPLPKKSNVYETVHEIQIGSPVRDHSDFYDVMFTMTNPKTASSESLSDEYEPIEYHPLAQPMSYQRFENYAEYPESDIWFEGTYRNLSIVPEEDEDETTSLLSSNYQSASSSKFYDSSIFPELSSSDSESDESSENIVKAEVKLLVKTTENGKEEIEIRSVREFLEPKKHQALERPSCSKNRFSNIFKGGKQNLSLNLEEKPSFTLPQMFVRTPEKENCDEGNRTELVAKCYDRFPLKYSPEKNTPVDLYANIPFFPCYDLGVDQYGLKPIQNNPFTVVTSNPFTDSKQIPKAYCDWLSQEDSGLGTTTERFVASYEETLLDKPVGQPLTGLSLDDNLVANIEQVYDQTNAFIRSESQPEPYDAVAEKYTKKEEPSELQEKRMDDNKNNINEKKKNKKGFFGSLKTFVEKSLDQSDSDSEKSPKKSKKPKKEKKKKGAKPDLPLATGKPKLPTPPLEPHDLDSIPYAEASPSDMPPSYKPPAAPLTDLDADGQSPKRPPKPKGKTDVAEKTKTTTKPVLEKEHFSVVVDSTKKSKETYKLNIDESIENIEKEILKKSPILSPDKIVKPMVDLDRPLTPVKDPHIYEDVESPQLSPRPEHIVTFPEISKNIKIATTDMIQNELNFGAWAEDQYNVVNRKFEPATKEKKEEVVEKQDKEKAEASPETKKKSEAKDKKGFLGGLFKKSKKDSLEDRKPLSEIVLKEMDDSKKFLLDEVEHYHDVRPIVPEVTMEEIILSDGEESEARKKKFGIFKKSKKDSEDIGTEKKGEVVQIQSKPADVTMSPEKTAKEAAKEEPITSDGEEGKSSGFFGLFKKPKKDYDDVAEKKEAIESDMRLSPEKTVKQAEKIETIKEDTVLSDGEEGRSIGFFGIFKKSKKDSEDTVAADKKEDEVQVEPTDVTLSPEKLAKEYKPAESEVKEKSVEPEGKTDSKDKGGFLGLFKKSKKDEEDVAAEKREEAVEAHSRVDVTLSPGKSAMETKTVELDTRGKSEEPEVKIDAKDKGGFLGLFKKPMKDEEDEKKEEAAKVQGKPAEVTGSPEKVAKEAKPEPDVKEKSEEPETKVDKDKGGFLGIFKKPKKDDEVKPVFSEAVIRDMEDSKQFLNKEIENFHDVKPFTAEKSAEVVDVQPVAKLIIETKDETAEKPESADETTKDKKKETKHERKESKGESGGFFGLFKKSKKEEEPVKLTETVVKDMEDSKQFLAIQVDKDHDVKPLEVQQPSDTTVTSVTTKITPEGTEVKTETIQVKREIIESNVEPSKTEITEKMIVTKVAVKETTEKVKMDTEDLETKRPETELDAKDLKIEAIVKTEREETESETKDVKKETKHERKESKGESGGFFGLFKKSKKDEEPVIPTESVLKDMEDSKQFLAKEVDKYHDVKPLEGQQPSVITTVTTEITPEGKEVTIKTIEEKIDTIQSKVEPSKTEIIQRTTTIKHEVKETKEEIRVGPQDPKAEPETKSVTTELKSEPAEKAESEIKDTEAEDETKDKKKESKHERKESKGESGGFFGIFKKSKKDEEPVPRSVLSDTVVQDMETSEKFLQDEVDKYHDVKIVTTEEEQKTANVDTKVEEVKEPENKSKKKPKLTKADSKESKSVFGLFKKSKKDEDAKPETIKDSCETQEASEVVEVKVISLDAKVPTEVESKVKSDAKSEPVESDTKDIKAEAKDSKEAKSESVGFLGLFKKSKKDDKPQLSEISLKEMEDTKQFLSDEVENYEDVKPVEFQQIPDESLSKEVSEIVETALIKAKEDKKGKKKEKSREKRESSETRLESKSESAGFFGLFKKSKKDESEVKSALSESALKDMDESRMFLVGEIDRYYDYRDIAYQTPSEEEESTKTVVEVVDTKIDLTETEEADVEEEVALLEQSAPVSKETKREPSETRSEKEGKEPGSFFGLFKKSKKDSIEDSKVLSDSVKKDMDDSKQFLTEEVKKYHDVKPAVEVISESEFATEIAEIKVESKEKSGLFGIFKKPKKDLSIDEPKLSESVVKDMDDSKNFLTEEVERYHDVKPVQTAVEQTIKSEKPEVVEVKETKDKKSEPTVLFGIFKKSKKDQSIEEGGSKAAEEPEKLTDFKPIKELTTEIVESKTEGTEVKSEPVEKKSESPGLFGIFRKSKKEDVEPTVISESVIKDMKDSQQFLEEEVSKYDDAKPQITQLSEEVASIKTSEINEAKPETSETKDEKVDSGSFFGLFKKSKKEEELQETEDAAEAKLTEATDIKDGIKMEAETLKTEESIGFFSIFSKKEKTPERKVKKEKTPEKSTAKPHLSESLLKDITDSTQFLLVEVENYHDVRPVVEAVAKEPAQKIDEIETTAKSGGFFGLFKKPKKEEEDKEKALAEIVPKEMSVVSEEPPVITEIKNVTEEEPPKQGFLAKFKRTKKDSTGASPLLSREAQQSMDETTSFLKTELENYEDGIIQFEPVDDVVIVRGQKEKSVTFDDTVKEVKAEVIQEVSSLVELVKAEVKDVTETAMKKEKETTTEMVDVAEQFEELTEKVVEEQQDVKQTKKGKGKKLFNVFGKKSKSQDADARSGDESAEGSPKKQKEKRRKSSPFKFFEKSKRDSKEKDELVEEEVKVDEHTEKGMVKEEVLEIEISNIIDESGTNLSDEVLGSFEKKIEELKYSKETLKDIQLCRDFLFIEVDNYEDGKAEVVTDIDKDLDVGEVNGIEAEEVREVAEKIVDETVETAEKTKKGFFSKLGRIFSDTKKDVEEKTAAVGKQSEEALIKTKDGVKAEAQKIEDGAKSAAKSADEVVSAVAIKLGEAKDATGEAISGVKVGAGETLDEFKKGVSKTMSDARPEVERAAGATKEAIGKVASDAKATASDAVYATADVIEDLGKGFGTKAAAAKDLASEKANGAKNALTDATDKTVDVIGEAIETTKERSRELVADIKDKTVEAKESVEDASTKTTEVIKDTADKAKQQAEATVIATDVTFTDFVDSVSAKFIGAQDSARVSVEQAADKATQDAKANAEKVVDKTEKSLTHLSESVEKKLEEVKDDAKSISEKTSASLAEAKESVKETTGKVSKDVDEAVDHLNKKATETKEATVKAAVTAKTDVGKQLNEAKAAVEETSKSLAKVTKDAKDITGKAAVSTKDAVAKKVDQAKDDAKEASKAVAKLVTEAKETAGQKADKAKDTAKGASKSFFKSLTGAKDSANKKLDKTKESAKEAAKSASKAVADAKYLAGKKADKTKESAKETSKIVAKSVKEAKEATVKAAATTKEAADKKVEKAKNGAIEASKIVAKSAKDAKDATSKKVDEAEASTKEALDKAAQSVGKTTKDAKEATEKAATTMKSAATEKVDEAENVLEETSKSLAKSVSDAKDATDEKLDKAKDTVVKTASDAKASAVEVAAITQEVVAKTIDEAKETANEASEAVVQSATETRDAAGKRIDNVKVTVASSATELKELAVKTAVATTAAVGQQFDKVKDTMKETSHSVAETVTEVKDTAAKKIDETKDTVTKSATDAREAAAETTAHIRDASAKKIDEAKDAAKIASDSVAKSITDVKDTTGKRIDEAKRSVAKSATDVKETASKIFETKVAIEETSQSIAKSLTDAKEEADKKIGVGQTAISDVGEAAAKFAVTTQEVVSEKADEREDAAIRASETVVKSITEAKEAIGQKVVKTKESGKEAFNKSSEVATSMKVATAAALTEAQETANKNLHKTKDSVAEAAKSTAQAAMDAKEAADRKMLEAKESAIEAIEKTSQSIAKSATEAKEAVVDSVAATKQAAAKKADEALKSIAQSVAQTHEAVDKQNDEAKVSTAQAFDKTSHLIAITTLDAKETAFGAVSSTEEAVAGAAASTKKAADEKINETKIAVDKASKSIAQAAAQATDTVGKTIDEAKLTTKEVLDTSSQLIFKSATDAKEVASESVSSKKKEAVGVVASIKEAAGKKVDTTKDIAKEAFEKSSDSVMKLATDAEIAVESQVREAKDDAQSAATKTLYATDKTVKDAAHKIAEGMEDLTKVTETKIASAKEKTLATAEKIAAKTATGTKQTEKTITETFSKAAEGFAKSLGEAEKSFETKFDETKHAIKTTVEGTAKRVDESSSKAKDAVDDNKVKIDEKVAAKAAEVDEELAKLTESLQQDIGESTFASYVTSPKPTRRAVSQRYPKGDRPEVREVTADYSVEGDEDSDYTVTEPEDSDKKRKPLFHIASEDDELLDLKMKTDRSDSSKSNVLETLTENKLDTLLTSLESQLTKDLAESTAPIPKPEIGSKVKEAEVKLESIKKDSQADVDQIEQKLRDLDKALDSLEEASEPDPKEKKLHRVERKFERMASEVMDKDVSETKVSPGEAERKRETEFQRLVSQMSTEEVSDFQHEYSHLWDETTFSKSDEWDSKTPDSQLDVQELPQGALFSNISGPRSHPAIPAAGLEVVYMGPIVLNKDQSINKAGIEVNVIPIMRSPCPSPIAKRRRPASKRAKSALDFYENGSPIPVREFDRGSLPDLKKSPSKQGSLVNTILQDPEKYLYGSRSTMSVRSSASSFEEPSNDLSRGEIMNAVMDWLERSNMTDSFSDSLGGSTDSGLSLRVPPPPPVIRVSKDRKKRETAEPLTEAAKELKAIPQPKPRFAKDIPTTTTNITKPQLEKQISPVRDDLLDDEGEEQRLSYSDRKKFWENVSKESKASPKLAGAVPLPSGIPIPSGIPVPKPRAGSSDAGGKKSKGEEEEEEEEENTKIMTEYQASFQPPTERKRSKPSKTEESDSDSDNVVVSSNTNDNAGYISDSGDVEQYISDSEIEDRVPQIRERQMSVFAPPVAAARKTIYERSASLPTEDLYEVSARSSKLRKQYYEEQIKKEMIEEQLTSEIEEEPSPERKTLVDCLIEDAEDGGKTVKDISRSFEKKEESIHDIKDFVEITHTDQIPHAHSKETDSGPKRTSSQSSSSEKSYHKDSSKPDSMEVHVDKSEIEDSEKLAELDQETDVETKSLDSLNTEMSPKFSAADEQVPEITVTLSGMQRRISEESDEYAPKKKELDSPINVPEEHIEDTVWEVSVQSQQQFDEKVSDLVEHPVEKIDDELSLSTRDESDLGSEIHQDHSDSFASDKIKSESQSDIERIILDSLHQQKVDPKEAKAIASQLIEEIEAEIQKRESVPQSGNVKEYLKYLAETKGLDEREVELVESVLARRSRELAKLSRGDTQASSIEITDEDLRYSGAEIDSSHLLEQQISQLRAEKVDEKSMYIQAKAAVDKINEEKREEIHSSKDTETFDENGLTGLKSSMHAKAYEKNEKIATLEEEDETSESATNETRIEAVASETLFKIGKDSRIDETKDSTVDITTKSVTQAASSIKSEVRQDDTAITKADSSVHTSDEVKSKITHKVDASEKKIDEETHLTGTIVCDDSAQKVEFSSKSSTSESKETDGMKFEKDMAHDQSHSKTVQSAVFDKTIEEKHTKGDLTEETLHRQQRTSTSTVDVVHEVSTTNETKEQLIELDSSAVPDISGRVLVEKHEEIKRTSSSDSKSSIESSGKSPEDQFSTCSSGRKGDSETSKVQPPEVTLRKSAVLKQDRKSGLDFEAYSSSGESHYHSFELDSGKSRPCSSDVEGLVAAGSSEYESALTSQDYSGRSHITSTEYQTAVSSLSSKESMKSLDSESSGHLGSIEVSELSETLVPSSDVEDILDSGDHLDEGWTDEPTVDKETCDTTSKMKRSCEMTFQPEPKMLAPESPQTIDDVDKRFTSMDESSSIISMSLSSTSSVTGPRTVIELSRADSERGGSMTVSGTSLDQISGSCDSLVFHPSTPSTTVDIATSTFPYEATGTESVTITTTTIEESGIKSVQTQVTSQTHSPVEEQPPAPIEDKPDAKLKKKGHRRTESTSFVPASVFTAAAELTESDKFLSFKECSSDEKKDVDEKEKDESYETEADQGFHRDVREGKYQYDDEAPKKRLSSEDIKHTQLEKRDSHGKSSSTSSEKSSFEEAEAEAAFNMVAHISPAHKAKQICPILEDEDAEKHELETRERAQKEAQKELERRRALMKDQSPGSIPDIKVTQHMTPLVDKNFHYPDLELEAKELKEAQERAEKESHSQKSTPQTPASSKSSEDTDQGREYVLEDSGISIPEDPATESRSTVIERTAREEETDSPNSDSFEMLEKPDLIDDFVVIEEVAKEAQEFDTEGKSVSIKHKFKPGSKPKPDEEIEAYLTKSAPTPLTKMTDVKFYPEGSSSEELGFDFEDSPPQLVNQAESSAASYDKELEANKQWIEQQFQGDPAVRMAAGYDYEMDFERGPLEDIKEEDINDFDPTSSRIGSLGSQKGESGGSLGSVKDSYSSTPEYDVLAGRKYFTRSGEQDDVSMSSLQEFENLERAMSLENRKAAHSQDSSSNGSFKARYIASKSGQGDDVSVSSLKEFEGLEMACIAAHTVEVKADEEEAMLAQIEEGQESLASESESCETATTTDKKQIPDSDEEDYEKRMFEIDEIIKQAQTNVERFIDLKDGEKTESLGRGDSIEEVSKVPDLDLDAPLVKSTIKVQWKENEDAMVTSTDSIEAASKIDRDHDSTDSLDQKTGADVMSASTDSIEFQAKKHSSTVMSDSIEMRDDPSTSGIIMSDSLELKPEEAGASYMVESTDSLHDPTSSTATSATTHATYQYESDSVFSGSFTSGGSNTMVSSTDTIDPIQVDIGAAARKVYFDEEMSGRRFTTEYMQDTGKPYVTEVIEPSEDDSYSHTIHRRVELPPEVRKVTFYGSDADERLRQFIEDFDEGEQVEEVEEVDAAGNVHTRRVVQKRVIMKGDETMTPQQVEEYFKQIGPKLTKPLTKETTGEEAGVASATSHEVSPSLKAQASKRRQLRYEISIDDQIEVDPREHDWRFNLPEHAEEDIGAQHPSQSRQATDQHQLSDEMKQLLQELEKESKQ